MSDFDEVLERLLTDEAFRVALAADPDTTLARFSLDEAERDLLRAQLVSGADSNHLVEDRTSKSTMVGLLGPVLSAFGFGASGGGSPGGPSGTQNLTPVPEPVGQQHLIPNPRSGVAVPAPAPEVAADYRTEVDVDGDHRWDPYVAHERSDGGVDILVDRNEDGSIDFVGHDVDRDGLVDSADFDTDGDGRLDTRMHDDTGDGWMDRRGPLT